MLTFKGPTLQAVINDANAHDADILLVKDQGVVSSSQTNRQI